jgi:putative restriction endonuclease
MSAVMKGYIAHTDPGWWDFLRLRPELHEVNFWRPGGRRFAALAPGEPLFFRLKSPINRIGGFGLFARYASLPVWRAWEVFGHSNGTTDEGTLLARVARLARRPVQLSDSIGCVAVTDCVFFESERLLDVPASFNPQNLSGSLIDLEQREGRELWTRCLAEATTNSLMPNWVPEAAERERYGRPQLIVPRLGQGSFRLAVMDAYGGGCAVTGEHSLPALEAVHIRPYSVGGSHTLPNGLSLRRDLHRLFDLGYVSVSSAGRFLVSPRLRSEFANGRSYYALAGKELHRPLKSEALPDPQLLEWHSDTVFLTH